MPLKAALSKLEAGDVAAAVPLLLEAWRETPDGRLAEVLDALSSRLNRPRRVFPKVTELDLDAYSIDPSAYEWLWAPEFAHLTGLTFSGGGARSLGPWLAATSRAPPGAGVELIQYHHQGFEFRLLPGRKVLEVASRAVPGLHVTTLKDLAQGAQPLAKTLTTIRILTRSTKADRAAFEALLAPGGTLELSAP